MAEQNEGPSVFVYQEVDWDNPLAKTAPGTAPPKALVEQARKTGARRKKIVQGEGGFFMNRSSLPPGFRIPPHQHNHNEMFVVLRGGCRFDDDLGELGADDTIVIRANTRYGFTCGDEGMEFLTIRVGDATVSLTQ